MKLGGAGLMDEAKGGQIASCRPHALLQPHAGYMPCYSPTHAACPATASCGPHMPCYSLLLCFAATASYFALLLQPATLLCCYSLLL